MTNIHPPSLSIAFETIGDDTQSFKFIVRPMLFACVVATVKMWTRTNFACITHCFKSNMCCWWLWHFRIGSCSTTMFNRSNKFCMQCPNAAPSIVFLAISHAHHTNASLDSSSHDLCRSNQPWILNEIGIFSVKRFFFFILERFCSVILFSLSFILAVSFSINFCGRMSSGSTATCEMRLKSPTQSLTLFSWMKQKKNWNRRRRRWKNKIDKIVFKRENADRFRCSPWHRAFTFQATFSKHDRIRRRRRV